MNWIDGNEQERDSRGRGTVEGEVQSKDSIEGSKDGRKGRRNLSLANQFPVN